MDHINCFYNIDNLIHKNNYNHININQLQGYNMVNNHYNMYNLNNQYLILIKYTIKFRNEIKQKIL